VHALTTPEVDIAPVGGEPYSYPKATNGREILEMFDRNVTTAREAITRANEEQMAQPWTLSHAGKPIFTLPRSAVVRQVVLNHIIHHRAILCVYLRLNDIPVPGMYGPSGDE
jgi:predicted membrane-bound mannosyltransferase